jgi:hypothetical protein
LAAPLDLNAPSVLWVTCGVGRCILDTGSDTSLALRELLAHRCMTANAIEIAHLGGVTILEEMGTLHLDGAPPRLAALGIAGFFAVDAAALPEGVVALLGVPDIRRLSLSLDYVLANPGCDSQAARPSNFLDTCLRFLGVRRHRAPIRTAIAPPETRPRSPADAPPETPPPRLAGGRQEPPVAGTREPQPGSVLIAHTALIQRQAQAERTSARIAQLLTRPRPDAEERDPLARQSSSAQQPVAVPSSPGPRQWVIRSTKERELDELMAALEMVDRVEQHKGKWYAVARGRQLGVFATWAECEPLVKGFPRARYKSFWKLQDARAFVLEAKAESLGQMQCRLQTSSFVGGKALRALVDILDGSRENLQVLGGLDSGSDVNLSLRVLLHDVRPICDGEVSNCGDATSFAEEGRLIVSVRGEAVSIPALVADRTQLPIDCSVLLGVPGLDSLGVMLDAHRKGKRVPLECHVGERILRSWLEANEGRTVTSVPSSIAEVKINPDLPAATQEKIRQMLVRHENVFAGELDILPKPFAAAAVSLKFVDQPTPQSVPEPRWTLAQKTILTQ